MQKPIDLNLSVFAVIYSNLSTYKIYQYDQQKTSLN